MALPLALNNPARKPPTTGSKAATSAHDTMLKLRMMTSLYCNDIGQESEEEGEEGEEAGNDDHGDDSDSKLVGMKGMKWRFSGIWG